MLDFDRRLRQVAQLRKLWRAFRDPQERQEDACLARVVLRDRGHLAVREPVAAYGRPAIRAAIRRWWCAGEYAALAAMGGQLHPAFLEEEPLVRVYVEEAKARLASAAGNPRGG